MPPPAAVAEPVPLAGTTTAGAGELAQLFARHGLSDGGRLELACVLVAEPQNQADPAAVAVLVEERRVGYLPGHVATQVALPAGETLPGRVQLWAAADGGSLRVVGWVCGPKYGAVVWPHTDENPPPVTVAQQRQQAAADTSAMVAEALTGNDPRRRAEFEAGITSGGVHYLETVEPIKQLKRDDRTEEALALCYAAIAAAENDLGRGAPPPWYTEQAAIVHRKRGEHDAEVAVLERWLAHCPPDQRAGSRIQERLDKLRR